MLPGPTLSEGIVDFPKSVARDPAAPSAEIEARFFARDRSVSLIPRMIEPGEIASLVAQVASPLAAATHGAAPRLDGGLTPTMAQA